MEKTQHPCQFSVELVERLVLSLTNKGDRVFDPFSGVGSSIIAAILYGRKGLGGNRKKLYQNLPAKNKKAINGTLRTRPMNKPKYDPKTGNSKLTISPWVDDVISKHQLNLLD